jgi:resolvase-like protein
VVTEASGQPTSGLQAPPALGVLGDSARAGEPAPGAAGRAAREPWHRRPAVKAAALFAAITAIGIAEVFLVGLPAWSAYVSAAVGALVGLDQLQLARRSRPTAAAPAAPVRGADARRVLGYTNLPVADDGRALVADTSAVRTWCAEAGAVLVEMVHDVGGHAEREALAVALDRIAAGEVGSLVVPRLDCLAPGPGSLPPLLRRLAEADRALVAIDLELDTATEAGRKAAHALVAVASPDEERAPRSRGGGDPGPVERMGAVRAAGVS